MYENVIPENMANKKIVVVGGGAAALSVVMNARKENRNAQIVMISNEHTLPYSRCGLPFTIDKEISDTRNLITQKENFFKIINVSVRLRSQVVSIDKDAKTVTYADENRKETVESYDALILCTGARPFIPPIPGVEKDGVFTLRTMEDAILLNNRVKSAKRAVVVGAGLIGIETAYALKKAGINVALVEILDTILKPLLDAEMARYVQEKIERQGIKIFTGRKVESIEGQESVNKVIVSGEEFPCDILIFATGVRPNTDLAKNSGVHIGERGGIKTNERMETNIPEIYAAGDCVEVMHRITGKPVLSQLGTSAVRQGKVAGINAVGGNAIYKGTLNASVTRIFDIEVGSVGLTEWQAKELGIDTVGVAIPWKTRAEYFPNAGELKLKLLFMRENMRVIGAQIVTTEGAQGYVNLISLAIDKASTASDLVHLDACYSPPVADVWNAVSIAAELAMKKT